LREYFSVRGPSRTLWSSIVIFMSLRASTFPLADLKEPSALEQEQPELPEVPFPSSGLTPRSERQRRLLLTWRMALKPINYQRQNTSFGSRQARPVFQLGAVNETLQSGCNTTKK
jgi:hypothetical protein